MDEPVSVKEFANYTSVVFALHLTVEGLQDFVNDSLKTSHSQIYRKLASNQCTVNCSRKFGNCFSKWCACCSNWRNELEKLHRNRRTYMTINWKDLDTIDMPTSLEEMAKVFVQDFRHSSRRGVLNDLGSLMSLFFNMKNLYNIIGQHLIVSVQNIRNNHFAHNYSARLDDTEKQQSLLVLQSLLNVREIASTESSKNVISMIEEMKTCTGIPDHFFQEKHLELIVSVIREIRRNVTLDDSLNALMDRNEHLRIREALNSSEFSRRPPKQQTILCACIVVLLVFVAILIFRYMYLTSSTGPSMENQKGCMSMRFEDYWRSDLDFDVYVEDLKNQSTIDRHWLEPILENALNDSKRGIIITAGMGYGKSSIVSQIICAEKKSIWNSIRQSVLAYHMCRYDVVSSYEPGTFIKNLAGYIVKNFPELGNSILSDDRAMDFLLSSRCKEDPIICLEFTILNPLKSTWGNRNFTIVIDAIDECITSHEPNMYSFLHKMIKSFPPNIRFIITSRILQHILENYKYLKVVDLTSFREDNFNDIRSFIDGRRKLDKDYVENLLTVSDGNFLHAKLSLEYCILTNYCIGAQVPDNLDSVYLLNMKRIFGRNTELFSVLYDSLAILCSIHTPIEEHELLTISGLENEKRNIMHIFGNELGHFIKFINGTISFQHKTFVDFLTNPSRKHSQFYIDEHRGHRLYAKFLLKSINLTETDDIAKVVYHVALSKNIEFELWLFEHYKHQRNISTEALFVLVARYNSFYATTMMLKLLHASKIHLNMKVLSEAAFVSAINSQDDSLKALLENGAMIKYRNLVEFEVMPDDVLHSCRYIHYCGYNYLHVAAQLGNIQMVKYLLYTDQDLLNVNNSLDRNAFQVAAENGHTAILEVMLKFNSSLADFYSLYHSALRGQYHAVEMLLQYVKDECTPCLKYNYINIIPLHKFTRSKTVQTKMRNITLPIALKGIVVIDFSTCDSVLSVAAENGHLDIVKLLLQRNNETINCSTIHGDIPIMRAIKNRDFGMFKYLYQAGSNIHHTCQNSNTYYYSIGNISHPINKDSFCPIGAGISHLIAIYDPIEIIRFVDEEGLTNWDKPDSQGLTPIHYAFCHNSVNFILQITFIRNITLDLNIKSNNGSTPLHIAVLCRSYSIISWENFLPNRYLDIIQNIFDEENRSVLQYSLLSPLIENDTANFGQDYYLTYLFRLVNQSKHDLFHTDLYGRNFVHYACTSGNYFAMLETILNPNYKSSLTELLRQKDMRGQTPVDVAFETMPEFETFQPFKLQKNCNLGDVFLTSCDTNFTALLSPHELVILTIFQFLAVESNFDDVNVTELLVISMNKSRLYPILILRTYAYEGFLAAFQTSDIAILMSKSGTPFLSEIILETRGALQCEGRKSPLHKILQNKRNMIWRTISDYFLNLLFVKHSKQSLDDCFDSEGFNLLHAVVSGGHAILVKNILDKGMNPLVRTKSNDDILALCIESAPYTKNGTIPLYYNYLSPYHRFQLVSPKEKTTNIITKKEHTNFDETAVLILQILYRLGYYVGTNRIEELCGENRHKIGLVQIAAAKGMISFLKKARQLFGNKILQCNDNEISVSYLAYIYRQEQVVQWLESLQINVRKPHFPTQLLLLYNFIDNYGMKHRYNWKCFVLPKYRFEGLMRNQVLRCLFGNKHKAVFEQNPYKHFYYQWLFKDIYNNLNADLEGFERMIYRLCRIARNLANATKQCLDMVVENFIQALRIRYRHKRWHTFVVRIYMKLLLFGYDDKQYLYHIVLKHFGLSLNKLGFFASGNIYEKLFKSVDNDKYRHFDRLRMETDLHVNWLQDFLEDKYSNLWTKLINVSLTEYEIITQDELVNEYSMKFTYVDYYLYKERLDRFGNNFQYQFQTAEIFIKENIRMLSELKSVDQINCLTMGLIPGCHCYTLVSNYSMKRYLEFISDLDFKARKRFKPQIIELEILAKRMIRKINGMSLVENTNTKVTDFCPYFHQNKFEIQIKILRCLSAYYEGYHLTIFRKFLQNLVSIIEETISYDFYI